MNSILKEGWMMMMDVYCIFFETDMCEFRIFVIIALFSLTPPYLSSYQFMVAR